MMNIPGALRVAAGGSRLYVRCLGHTLHSFIHHYFGVRCSLFDIRCSNSMFLVRYSVFKKLRCSLFLVRYSVFKKPLPSPPLRGEGVFIALWLRLLLVVKVPYPTYSHSPAYTILLSGGFPAVAIGCMCVVWVIFWIGSSKIHQKLIANQQSLILNLQSLRRWQWVVREVFQPSSVVISVKPCHAFRSNGATLKERANVIIFSFPCPLFLFLMTLLSGRSCVKSSLVYPG